MTIREFIHKKSTHIVLAIIAINIAVWVSWTIFKPAVKSLRPTVTRLEEKIGPPKTRSYTKSAPSASELRRMRHELDSLKIVAAIQEKADREAAIKDSIAAVIAKEDSISTIQFVFDNWAVIFTIVTALPVIVLKWEQTIHKIKAMHKKVTN